MPLTAIKTVFDAWKNASVEEGKEQLALELEGLLNSEETVKINIESAFQAWMNNPNNIQIQEELRDVLALVYRHWTKNIRDPGDREDIFRKGCQSVIKKIIEQDFLDEKNNQQIIVNFRSLGDHWHDEFNADKHTQEIIALYGDGLSAQRQVYSVLAKHVPLPENLQELVKCLDNWKKNLEEVHFEEKQKIDEQKKQLDKGNIAGKSSVNIEERVEIKKNKGMLSAPYQVMEEILREVQYVLNFLYSRDFLDPEKKIKMRSINLIPLENHNEKTFFEKLLNETLPAIVEEIHQLMSQLTLVSKNQNGEDPRLSEPNITDNPEPASGSKLAEFFKKISQLIKAFFLSFNLFGKPSKNQENEDSASTNQVKIGKNGGTSFKAIASGLGCCIQLQQDFPSVPQSDDVIPLNLHSNPSLNGNESQFSRDAICSHKQSEHLPILIDIDPKINLN